MGRTLRLRARSCVEALRGLVLLLSLALSPRLVQAEEPGESKVLLVDPGAPALTQRLAEEVESLGLEVKIVAERVPEVALDEWAREAGALAAIRVTERGAGSVEMTIVDRATGKMVSRRLAVATPRDPASAELIATRTVELLRASLMELAADHPARGEVPVTADVEELGVTTEPATQLSLAAGPFASHSAGFGISAGAWAGIALLTPLRVGVSAQLFLSLEPGELASSEGQVELSSSIYRLGGVFEFGPLGAPLTGSAHAGLLLSRLTISGSAESPYFGVREEAIAWGPWAGLGAHLALADKVGLVLGADMAFTFPKTVVRAAGRELTTWGRPLYAAAAGVEMVWP